MLCYLKPGTLGFCQKHCWVRLGQQAASAARLDVDHFYHHLDLAIFKSTYQLARTTSICLKATMGSEIVGFVIWVDPDHPQVPRIGPPSNEQEREEHRAALARIHTGADMTLLKSMEEQQSVAESKVDGKHWYLANLVVKRDRQGLGIGSVLLEWGLTRADAASLQVFCLSSEAVSVCTILWMKMVDC